MSSPPFEELTETTGVGLTMDGATQIITRYSMAATLGAGRRVLEIGCGSGQGLGLIRSTAATLVGADFSPTLLARARDHYGTEMPLVRLSADALPFRAESFDLVVCFEASYYVPDMERGFDEMVRVLAPGGSVIFANTNPERSDFIRSPFSVRYHTADEFRAALTRRGLRVNIEGALGDPPGTRWADRVRAAADGLARRILERLHLVPRTLRGRARLKRLVYRAPQTPVPNELKESFAPIAPRYAVQAGPVTRFSVLYVRGDKPPLDRSAL